MMPLVYAEAGEPQIIKKIGGNPEVKKHLSDLGFNVGGEVSVINSLGEKRSFKLREEHELKTLKDVKIGETAKVIKVHGEGAIRRRIMDMGITKNTSVYVRKVAPLGDPLEITVRSYELTLRKADAEMVEVE